MMNRHSGSRIGSLQHLQQSIADIITTLIGTRAMRREYGSWVPALIDQPDNLLTQTRLFAAVAGALMRWEPRLQTIKIKVLRDPAQPGRADLEITGDMLSEFARRARPVRLSIPLGGAT